MTKDRPPIAVHDAQLSRDLSEFDITMIGVGAMIGAGVFVLTGIAAGVAGPALILSFALNGVVTIFTAMVYAELGSAIPEAGGGYLWVKEALGKSNGFLAGWMSWFSHAVAGSLYALGFGSFLALLLRDFGVPLLGMDPHIVEKIFGVGIAFLFLYINFRGGIRDRAGRQHRHAGQGDGDRALHLLRAPGHRPPREPPQQFPAFFPGGIRGGLPGHGDHLHRLRGLRDHRAGRGGGGGPPTNRPPCRLQVAHDRGPHLRPGGGDRHRSGAGARDDQLGVPRVAR